jgi:hypothetical protein
MPTDIYHCSKKPGQTALADSINKQQILNNWISPRYFSTVPLFLQGL